MRSRGEREIRIADLGGTPMEIIHTSFVSAFADYGVSMQPTLLQLRRMLVRRGFDPRLSFGAFDHDFLAGFILNGSGIWQGKATAYDAGTGVVPSHRGRGLSRRLLEFALPTLREKGARQYLLEVIETNEPALGLYRSSGFETKRRLCCYTLGEEGFRKRAGGWLVREGPPEMPAGFHDCDPSWQNSTEAIRRSTERPIFLQVRDGTRLAGYAVLFPDSADLAQLAVDRSRRREGIGTSLLSAALERVRPRALRILNIDESARDAGFFLRQSGAARLTNQLEMVRSLSE